MTDTAKIVLFSSIALITIVTVTAIMISRSNGSVPSNDDLINKIIAMSNPDMDILPPTQEDIATYKAIFSQMTDQEKINLYQILSAWVSGQQITPDMQSNLQAISTKYNIFT